MEEKQIIRNKRQYNALEDKLSSQIKRIQQLLKSGDIPWLRVKSAYSMCQIAIAQISQQIIDIYPLKQYLKLSQMILSELLQNINDDSEDDPTIQIQSRLMKPKSNRNKMLSSSNTIRDQSPYVSKRKIEIKSQRKIETVLGESLVQNQLKKVIEGLNNTKTTLIQQIINKKVKEKDTQSQDFSKQLNGIVGDWKGELLQKHKQLNKWVQQNKIQHIQALKKKDLQIQKLIKQFEFKKCQLHCGVQTLDLEQAAKDISKQLRQKQIQYNSEKERFIRITKGYQKEILQLKKHNKTLRTSSHLKLEQYQKNILQMIEKIKYLKSEFKQYFEEIRYIESIFFDVVEKHQKAKTPFIPKNQIQQVYQKMKKNGKKQHFLSSILLDQQRESSKKTIKKEESTSKTKKLASIYNEPLLDVLDIPSKLSKIRNSTRSNYSKNSSFSLAKDQTLPVIKVMQHSPSPRALGSNNSKSLYSDVRTILKQNQHYLSVINESPKRQGHTPKILSRKILNDNTRQNSIINLNGKGSQINLSSQNALKRESLRPIIKQLSKQNISSSQTLTVENKKQHLILSKNNITIDKKQPLENQQNQQYNFNQSNEYEGEQQINYVININKIDEQEQEDMSKKRTSINIDQRTLTKTVMNVSNIDNITIKHHHHTQHFAPKATRTYYRKQTNITTNKQKDSPKEIKKPIFQNKIQPSNILQKQINLFIQRYSGKTQYIQFQTQIAQSVQKVKQAHRSICTKIVCHHLKKFNDKVKKIKNQYYSRRPYKMAQLDIKHQK